MTGSRPSSPTIPSLPIFSRGSSSVFQTSWMHLCRALEEDRLEDAERLAHRLKGAGGSYGYPTLSEVAKSLELAAKAQDMGGATAALAEVKEVCAAIQTGWTSQTRTGDRSTMKRLLLVDDDVESPGRGAGAAGRRRGRDLLCNRWPCRT